MPTPAEVWTRRAHRFAFLGNSLLAPMAADAAFGLDEAFWDEFAAGEVEGPSVRRTLERLKAYARAEQVDGREIGEAVRRVNVEYARLFIGPPKPAAPPWETMYAQAGQVGEIGFGRATVAMQDLLAEAGLVLANENNQYADHLGIELLYLAELCHCCAAGADGGASGVAGDADGGSSAVAVAPETCGDALAAATVAGAAADEPLGCEERLHAFVREHPAVWAPAFRDRVAEAAPDGYFAPLAALVCDLLEEL
ncbi:TorD/DmsD family molecular chaperone [Gordonibacter urolithinfaciens]|uniref:TorD/DmsD family molecular chaperone n=1 Tax=Gordonibacter urolithinfaciens TaxID=1335613 RepID=UPI000F4BEE66|nr:molecular chaperone TorD family protein [Gordonibacter urolithinfaciens]ROT89297.1 molecular chaperone TorD [Gordonibacter urolithinfaciens]